MAFTAAQIQAGLAKMDPAQAQAKFNAGVSRMSPVQQGVARTQVANALGQQNKQQFASNMQPAQMMPNNPVVGYRTQGGVRVPITRSEAQRDSGHYAAVDINRPNEVNQVTGQLGVNVAQGGLLPGHRPYNPPAMLGGGSMDGYVNGLADYFKRG